MAQGRAGGDGRVSLSRAGERQRDTARRDATRRALSAASMARGMERMSSSFMTDPKAFFTSESVTEGHPDKLCDQISDGVLDALLAQDPLSRVACETATTTGLVLVAGEITTTAWADIPEIVRNTIKNVGYVDARYGFDYRTCGVATSIGK